MSLLPRVSDKAINLPNRDYWLAPPQREATFRFLTAHACWLGSLMVVFIVGIHLLLIAANATQPPRLPTQPFITLLVRSWWRSRSGRRRWSGAFARRLSRRGPVHAVTLTMAEKKAFLLRIDPALWAEIERLAQAELRSANAQVEFLLRDALARRGVQPQSAASVPQKRIGRMTPDQSTGARRPGTCRRRRLPRAPRRGPSDRCAIRRSSRPRPAPAATSRPTRTGPPGPACRAP